MTAADITPAVQEVFASYPPAARKKLLAIRQIILETAATLNVGPIEETLKWGEPSYLTKSKAGTTIRIAWKSAAPDYIGVYVNCQTTLVETFRDQFPEDFIFEGNRALVLPHDVPLPADALTSCIGAALTYHRSKRTRRSS